MPLQLEVLGVERVIRPEPGSDCDYKLCGSIAELREYLRPALQDRVAFGADWEATSLNIITTRPVGLGVSVAPKTGLYVPVGHLVEPEANLPVREVVDVLKAADAAGATSIWFNVAFDHGLMESRPDHWVPEYWEDAYFGVFLVDSNVLQLGLKESSQRFLGRKMQEITELDREWVVLSKKQQKLTPPKMPGQLPPSRVMPYGCADPDHTRQIWFHPKVQAAVQEQLQILRLEKLLSPVLREGFRYGVVLDPVRLDALKAEAEAKLAQLEPQIFEQFGEEFALSRKGYLAQRVKALIPDLIETTDGGQPTANVKVLAKYRDRHPVVPLLIMHAQLTAQRDNYIQKLRKAHAYFATQPWANGKVRFAFNHIGVPTGRMKCGGGGKGKEAYHKGVADVNAQSIPDHEKAPYLPNTRSAFCAPPGFVVVALDYSQIELRLPANLAREPKWIEVYQTGGDIHTSNAQIIANIREPGVRVTNEDKARRGGAKSTSFALLYGGDEFTVSRNANIPTVEAKAIVEAFYQGLPVLARWLENTKQHARSRGQIGTFLGRMRRLQQYFPPEPSRKEFTAWKAWRKIVARGEREAVNHPVQGGAADIFKTACVLIARAIRQRGWDSAIVSPQVLWIHDEVVLYVHRDWVTRVVPVIVEAMEFPIRVGQELWPVPLKAEPEVGSRHLYYSKQIEKARKDGRPEEAAAMAATLAALSADPTGVNSTWGELVSYEDWVRHYGERATGGCSTAPAGS